VTARPSEEKAGLTGWTIRAIAATLALAGLSRLWTDPAPLPAAPALVRNDTRIHLPATARPPLQGLAPGQVRSLLNIRERLTYGAFRWNEDGVPAGPVLVRVDRKAQILSVFRGGHEIGTAVILYGAPEKPTPAGSYPVLGKAAYHRSRAYNADMPHTLWLTRDGVAIHGSRVREGAATHGCVGLPDAFARKLFHEVKTGDPVVIV
jgi:lipoprotein-anchoring transpeptidase ErfK/SrfK